LASSPDLGSSGAALLAFKECHGSNATISDTTNTTQTSGPTPELKDMARALTEQRNPRSFNLDQMSPSDIVTLFIHEEDYVRQALAKAKEEITKALIVVAGALNKGGRLFYVGAGTSGRLGVLDASEVPPTFGEPRSTVQGIIAGGLKVSLATEAF
jgi:N-acetylmuramic acid 6-phosphate (MurNAc-6-P) etherase